MELKFKHFVFLQILDVITTYISLSYLTSQGLNELNPVYSYSFAHFGLITGLITIKLIGLIVIWVIILQYPLKIKKLALKIICIMFIFVIINNTYQIINVI